ncbi:Type-2 restriction enzyme BsoBI [Patescibacteria group bacterium]|nr:Type-2 restriction enzyme BsoBI [Patescibacteria group bacterium]
MNKYINKPEDLQTTYEETKNGFLIIALRKSKEASFYIEKAKAFKHAVSAYDNPNELIKAGDIQYSLCEAAGISTKAKNYLQPSDIESLLKEFSEEFLIPVGIHFVDEVVNRYLLTLGDALGGRMRNIVGSMAGEKLTQQIIATLHVRNYNFSYYDKRANRWMNGDTFRANISSDIKAIRWNNDNKTRLLCYDLTVPIVKKNIDIVLFNNDNVDFSHTKQFNEFKNNPSNYLMLGELKGGIDPAGADEHWKTANTALTRIRDAFKKENKEVFTLFIGAAIELAMAKEIYEQCLSGKLTNCANLTKDNQLIEICDWLICS